MSDSSETTSEELKPAHAMEERLALAEAKYRSLVEKLPGIVYIADFGKSGRWTYVSPQVEVMLGYTPQEWLADPELWFKRIHPDDQRQELINEEISRTTGEPLDSEYRMITRDGHEIWVRDEAVVVRDAAGQRVLMQGIMMDITHRKELEEQLRHQAFHDALTGLANRALFSDRVEHAIARRTRAHEAVTVLLLDLDDFKTINDSLGHAAGDELLNGVAGRLRVGLRPSDTVARLGGDEFAVLIEGMDRAGAERIAQRLLESLATPFPVQGHEVFARASMGVAESTGDESAEELLRRADLAMYVAKTAEKNTYEVFDVTMHSAVLERHEMKADLQRAVDRKEFTVHYQPIVDLESGRVISLEALVRWNHHERGLVLPTQFIHLAEETGLIIPLGRWVLEESCRQVKKWQEEWPLDPALTLNVNLSLRQLHDDRLVPDVLNALRESQFDPHHLILEITESMLMTRTQEILATLEQLKLAGVRIALDDFGTGYSSLGYLQGFPVDILKISKVFVDAVGQGGPEDSALAHAIIKLGSNLKLETVAEGIEMQGQLDDLQRFGCKLGQGFLLAHPLEAGAIGNMLSEGALRPLTSEG